jgi:hypothetical protein
MCKESIVGITSSFLFSLVVKTSFLLQFQIVKSSKGYKLMKIYSRTGAKKESASSICFGQGCWFKEQVKYCLQNEFS